MTTTKRGHHCSRSAFGKVRFLGHIYRISTVCKLRSIRLSCLDYIKLNQWIKDCNHDIKNCMQPFEMEIALLVQLELYYEISRKTIYNGLDP